MKEVIIAGYLRTAQSRSKPSDPSRDWLGNMRADDLLERLLPEAVKRAGIDPIDIDDLIVGSGWGVTENFTMGGRTPVFMANFPDRIAAKFVDQACGSSMAGIHIGTMEIQTGNAGAVIIAGIEHLTRVPMGMALFEKGIISPNMRLFSEEKYGHWDMLTTFNMGLTAEKLLGQTGFTREEMDAWGVRSHRLAYGAQQGGFFSGEIMPVEAPQSDGSMKVVDRDQGVRENVTMEDMVKLKPAYKPDGAITAGNSSPLNAGASSMILMEKELARKKGIRPLATIRSIGFTGVDPSIMGIGPVPSSRKALAMAGLEVKDIDCWEINEAFSIVTLYAIRELGIDPERVNVMGGGLAIGHPMGASGVRITGTLARILGEKRGRYGLATMCCGGGQGVATVIEREEYD